MSVVGKIQTGAHKRGLKPQIFPPIPREARDLISKIRSCTVRSDLKNKAFPAVFCLFLRSDLTVQDRILEIRSLASLGIGGKSFLRNRAFSGQIGTFSGPIGAFSGPIGTNSSAPHTHGGRAEIAPKGPFLAQLAPFGPSPPLLSPPLDFPDVGPLGDPLVGPLVGQFLLSPALCVAQFGSSQTWLLCKSKRSFPP